MEPTRYYSGPFWGLKLNLVAFLRLWIPLVDSYLGPRSFQTRLSRPRGQHRSGIPDNRVPQHPFGQIFSLSGNPFVLQPPSCQRISG